VFVISVPDLFHTDAGTSEDETGASTAVPTAQASPASYNVVVIQVALAVERIQMTARVSTASRVIRHTCKDSLRHWFSWRWWRPSSRSSHEEARLLELSIHGGACPAKTPNSVCTCVSTGGNTTEAISNERRHLRPKPPCLVANRNAIN
jgi:hypothetical protein